MNERMQVLGVPEDAIEALRAIAARNRISLSTAIEQAALNERFIEEQIDAGAKLHIEKNGKLRHLELE